VAEAPAAAPAAAASAALTKLALAGGGQIEASGTGVESQLLAFINDANAQIDKSKWFDFDRLNFETGSAKLTADSKAQVDNMAAILKAYPAVKIKIGGYTDKTGKPENNLKLSDARAKAVVEALAGLGIAADRLEAEGYGDQYAIADNATPEGRAKNRRIAVSVRAK
jgi:outer membrane protein OmpA-like peptidoglycan-associated protein